MTVTFTPLHDTFVAECKGVDFSKPVNEEDLKTIKDGIRKYGVLIFRQTGLTDATHVAFSHQLGPLDDVTPYTMAGRVNRLAPFDELFDVSNIDENGDIVSKESTRYIFGLGNSLFHVDSSFNPRRAGLSLLLAHELPPPGTGGNTEFADSRTAYADLSPEMKERIKDYVVNHSILQSRRKAAPGHPFLADPKYDPANGTFSKHKLVQVHEPTGRTNLYIATHAYSIDGLPLDEAQTLIAELLAHVSQPKYVYSASYHSPGDMVMWDDTAVLHRAVPGAFEGKHRRDMRRTTVHDDSTEAWGLNEVGATWRAGLP